LPRQRVKHLRNPAIGGTETGEALDVDATFQDFNCALAGDSVEVAGTQLEAGADVGTIFTDHTVVEGGLSEGHRGGGARGAGRRLHCMCA
jgi:hypothetical protein